MSVLMNPSVQKKRLMAVKSNAIKRKILKLGIISRTWNIHVTEDRDGVFVVAPTEELIALKKALKFRQKLRNAQHDDDWSYVVIPYSL
jgi:hypothetical protein